MTSRERKDRALDAYREYCASGDSFTEIVERVISAAIAEEREACALDVKSLVNDIVLCRIIVDAFYSRGTR